MERLDQLSRGLVVAGVDRVEHLFDEFRAQLVLVVDRAGIERRIAGGAAAMCSLSLIRAPLAWTRVRALLWSGPLWRNQPRLPKSRFFRSSDPRSFPWPTPTA